MGIKPRHNLTEPRGWFALFFAKGGVWVFAASVALVALTFFSVSVYREASRFERDGQETAARIVKQRIEIASDSDDSDDYFMTFSYDANGQKMSQESRVSGRFYRRNDIGATVTIRYLKSHPKQIEYFVGENRDTAIKAQLAALAAGVVGLGMLWYFGSRANNAVLARRYGERTAATISGFVEHKDSGGPTGKGYMVWRLEDGTRGESLSQPIRPLRALGKNTKIIIYVRNGDSVWEGDVGPRVLPKSRLPAVNARKDRNE